MHTYHKKARINPHTVWAVFCTLFIMAITALLILSSYYFIQVTRRLDAPVTPTFETSAAKIQAMQQQLDLVEKAVEARKSSQNSGGMVQ